MIKKAILDHILKIQKSSRVEVGFIFTDEQIIETIKGDATTVRITSKMVKAAFKKVNQRVYIAHTHPFHRHDNYLPSNADIYHFSNMYTSDAWSELANSFVVTESGYFSIKHMTFYCWNTELFNFLNAKKEKVIVDYLLKVKMEYTLKKSMLY